MKHYGALSYSFVDKHRRNSVLIHLIEMGNRIFSAVMYLHASFGTLPLLHLLLPTTQVFPACLKTIFYLHLPVPSINFLLTYKPWIFCKMPWWQFFKY